MYVLAHIVAHNDAFPRQDSSCRHIEMTLSRSNTSMSQRVLQVCIEIYGASPVATVGEFN